MARIIPPYIDSNCKSSGEKLIFNIFKNNSFTNDWIIFHSLNLANHVKRLYGEIDFLLLIPDGGIYVLEVKGGDVKCMDGVWYYTNRSNNTFTSNIGPFNQAREAMFSLRNAIRVEFGKNHRYTRIISGFFCVFPHINFDKRSIEYEEWQILDQDKINKGVNIFVNKLVYNTIAKHKHQKWYSENDSLPDKQVLSDISDFLRGDFERVRTIRARLKEFDSQVDTFTKEQFRILDSIHINPRSVTQGSAGTGKTMVAIESAIRLASERKKVFLTCYNKLISEWMQNQLHEWDNYITVSNLHGYMFSLADGFDFEKSNYSGQNFYEIYLPELLKDIFNKGIIPKFDKLIIDEGQDLIREEYLNLFDSMLIGGMSDGNWEIYGDFEKQAIYSQIQKKQMFEILTKFGEFSNFLLKINCRNTKQVGEETALISGFEKPPFLFEHLAGIPVEYLFYEDDYDQFQKISYKLDSLLSQNLNFDDVILLSPKKLESSAVNSLINFGLKEIIPLKSHSKSKNHFCFSTIQAYKGMESNFVLVTDIEDLSSDIGKSLLYIGMSRARYGLVIMIAEKERNQYLNILKRKLN